jgi:hypothetical protein
LGTVVLARFTRLAFVRFFFIEPVLPPLACVSTRRGEPYRRSGDVVKTLPETPDLGVTGDNTLLYHRWMV